jgi:hypothetical protein
MARPRKRVQLEDGLKLDLNRLVRQGLMLSCPVVGAVTFGPRGASGAAYKGLFVLILSTENHGSLTLRLGALTQKIALVGEPRHFGGRQWYFVCPILRRRASVLWMPPGASCFASRQTWGPEVAYASQFKTAPYRALARASDIRHRLGDQEYSGFDAVPPLKPKGMHRYTYETQLKRLESYERTCNLYVERLIARHNKV